VVMQMMAEAPMWYAAWTALTALNRKTFDNIVLM
jgi:hypothetical protein